MGRPKKIVDAIVGVFKKEQVEVVANVSCSNCNDSKLQCSVCTPVFEDTFGK